MVDLIRVKDLSKFLNYVHSVSADLRHVDWWLNEKVLDNNLYYIMSDKKVVGLIKVNFGKNSNNRKFAYVDYIEIFKSLKGYHFGIATVSKLFDSVSEIYGESYPDAITFWYKLGANFEMSKRKLMDEYLRCGYSACFRLSRVVFKRKVNDGG